MWRSEKNPNTGAKSQSLLWNLWRRDTSPGIEKSSLFFGLVQYESDASGRRWKWFHSNSAKPTDPPPEKPAMSRPEFSTSTASP
jgi:hypothetical protein